MSQPPKPALNMAHGFMRSIIRNQLERDNYDKEMQERREQERQAKTERRSCKNKRPEQARYTPPVRSQENKATAIVFKLEYEDEWGKLHELPIRRCDDPHEIAGDFGREHDMDDHMISALAHKLEYEMQIRL